MVSFHNNHMRSKANSDTSYSISAIDRINVRRPEIAAS